MERVVLNALGLGAVEPRQRVGDNAFHPADKLRAAVLFFVATAAVAPLHAEVRLPAFFSESMVLQRDREIPVWGSAKPGERVSVELAGLTAAAVADASGNWSARLPKLPAGGPHTLVVSGENRVTINDVLIGEVWLASGQSNMEWILKETDDAAAEIAAARHPRVRIFRVQRAVADAPRADVEGKWLVASPDKAGWMSAVAYHFARKLSAELDVPVGVINASRGAAQIIPFIPEPAIAAAAEVFAEDMARWRDAVEKFPARRAAHEAKLAETAPGARRPDEPYGPGHYNQPGGLFNGMHAAATPYAIRGFLWYQGEANAKRPAQYERAFPVLIDSWREVWGGGDLPFLFVQLAAYNVPKSGFPPEGLDRALTREAQAKALALPRTGMVVTLDVSGPDSQEHPRNKRPVGERLAGLAAKIAHGRDVVADGPVFLAHKIDGASVRIAYLGGTARGLAAREGGEIKGFFVAGADKVFHPAKARVEGETIRLSSEAVKSPVAARYAFSNDPVCNLVNSAGLPAAPFRTDDWNAVTSWAR